MKVAAYQAPLAGCADAQIISLIRQQVDRCEALGVEFLCCPEAVLGGLADHVDQPERIAIDTSADGLDRLLAPLASDRRDSLFREPAGLMASRGARLLLVPTNNGMPAAKGGPELVLHARTCDVARAAESRMPIVRADVAGVDGDLISYGSSGIVNGDGQVLGAARALEADLVIADVDIGEHHGRRPITPITVTPSSAASPGSAAR